jgi:hypothetical protein
MPAQLSIQAMKALQTRRARRDASAQAAQPRGKFRGRTRGRRVQAGKRAGLGGILQRLAKRRGAGAAKPQDTGTAQGRYKAKASQIRASNQRVAQQRAAYQAQLKAGGPSRRQQLEGRPGRTQVSQPELQQTRLGARTQVSPTELQRTSVGRGAPKKRTQGLGVQALGR